MDLSIVIPNYNGEDLLKKNLHKVLDEIKTYRRGKCEVIVIDDGSKDNSTRVLKEIKNKNRILDFYENEKNLGFSSTVNLGVKKSIGEIIILLNTDVFPEKNFLDALIPHFKDESVFAVGCMDKSIENDNIALRGRGIGEWKRGFLMHRRGEIDKTDTFWVSGGSSAFRKSIWEKLGGLEELYNPFYWEDIDISYRAQKSGYKILFEPKSVVVHEHEKGTINNLYSSKKIKSISYRNEFIFIWLNITDLDLQFSHLIWLPYHLTKAILRLDMALVRGFIGALIYLPKIIKSSIKYKKLFIKKDKEVIK